MCDDTEVSDDYDKEVADDDDGEVDVESLESVAPQFDGCCRGRCCCC